MAARAVFDAVPLLQCARNVTLLAVREYPGVKDYGSQTMKLLCVALLRHGIRTQTVDIQVPQVNVGAVILAEAKSSKADLVVMGCYGRSRLSEFVLGGATRHVLERTGIPVFMAH